MPWAAAAAVVAAGIGAYSSSEASSKAADAQKKASDAAFNTTQNLTAQARTDLTPYRDVGQPALQRLMYLMGMGDKNQYLRDQAASASGIKKPTWDDAAAEHLASHIKTFGTGYTANSDAGAKQSQTQQIFDRMTKEYNDKIAGLPIDSSAGADFGMLTKPFTATDLNMDPSYQFKLAEGEKALTRGASARGLAASTPGLKDLMRFNSGLASTEYQAAFNRDQATKGMTFNILQSMAGMGQNSAAGMGTATLGGANNAVSAIMAGGNAQAGGIMNAAQGQNAALQGGIANMMYQQRYNQTMGMYQSLLTQNQTTSSPGLIQEQAPGQYSTSNVQYG